MSLKSTTISTKKYTIKLKDSCAILILKDRTFETLGAAAKEAMQSVGHKVTDKNIFFMESFVPKNSKFLHIIIVFEF